MRLIEDRSHINKLKREWAHTKKGLSYKIYSKEVSMSKKRNHELQYNLREFRNWLFNNDKFEELYNNWVESGYETNLAPSVDRINDYEGYNFNNIRLITWVENRTKAHNDRKNGINNKRSRAIYCIDDNGIRHDFHSLNQAQRELKTNNLWYKLNKRIRNYDGYRWFYKNNENDNE